MGRDYTQLTLEDRCEMARLHTTGHWILAFARMTEGKGKDDRRRRCRHYNYLSVIPDPDRGSRVFAFSCVHEENGHWILAFARMTEGKGKDDRRRRCRHYNYLSVIPDPDRGSRVFAFSCVMKRTDTGSSRSQG